MRNTINILSSSDWPKQLREIPKPPQELFIRGALPTKEHTWITIVGSRRNTSYGKRVVELLMSWLQQLPVIIVSGLAIGIDTIVLKSALENNLTCVAIPGSGLHQSVLYPQTNVELAEEIVRNNGCLLSEYEPLQKAALWTFPRRNRIMAGLAKLVIIIEAQEKSGTLITAKLATDFNRDVAVIPGSIFDENSKGCHQLLKLGATPITNQEDLLEILHLESKTAQKNIPKLNGEEKEIYDLLIEMLPRQKIIEQFSGSTEACQALLASLLLRGVVEEQGMYIMRA